MSEVARHINSGRVGGEKLPGERAKHARLRRDPGDDRRQFAHRLGPERRAMFDHVEEKRRTARAARPLRQRNAKPIAPFARQGQTQPQHVRRIALLPPRDDHAAAASPSSAPAPLHPRRERRRKPAAPVVRQKDPVVTAIEVQPAAWRTLSATERASLRPPRSSPHWRRLSPSAGTSSASARCFARSPSQSEWTAPIFR